MSWDNRVFNVNGKSKEMLKSVITLALEQAGWKGASGWQMSIDKGLVLYWHIEDGMKGVNKLPSNLSADGLIEIIWSYLEDKETWEKTTFHSGDEDADHDGDNGKGWRVYCEGWGHVGDSPYAFIAVTPAYLWYGK